METHPRPLSVCVDRFDVEEKRLHFTPCSQRETQTVRAGFRFTDSITHTDEQLLPTIGYRCEFEHCVKGAPEIRQLIFRERGRKRIINITCYYVEILQEEE